MPRKRLRIQKKQLVIIGLLVVLFFLMMDLNSRLSELSRQTAKLETISTEVIELQKTEQVLQTQIAYATSEAAAEEWARQNGRMALPGDRVVVPLPPPGITPTPLEFPPATVKASPNWHIWRLLIFGE